MLAGWCLPFKAVIVVDTGARGVAIAVVISGERRH